MLITYFYCLWLSGTLHLGKRSIGFTVRVLVRFAQLLRGSISSRKRIKTCWREIWQWESTQEYQDMLFSNSNCSWILWVVKSWWGGNLFAADECQFRQHAAILPSSLSADHRVFWCALLRSRDYQRVKSSGELPHEHICSGTFITRSQNGRSALLFVR